MVDFMLLYSLIKKNFQCSKPPNVDTVGDSIELLLIRNQWEREAMQQLQLDLIAHMNSQTSLNESRIRKLSKIQSKLRKKLIEVSSFFKECDDKKFLAQKKVNEEIEKHETLVTDMEDCRTSIEELGKFKEELQSTVREFEPYERIMEEVVAEPNIYESVKDCMDRCDALSKFTYLDKWGHVSGSFPTNKC